MSVPAKTEAQKPKTEAPKPMATFREQLEQRLASFAEALPPHITPQRFKSVIMQAVMSAPELLGADRVSLFEACLAAANDGLVPDKREGALVIFNTKLPKTRKTDPDEWIKKVQWLPMVRGIITKVYQTEKVKSVSMEIVYGGDHFRHWIDDAGEHLEHVPDENRDKSKLRRVYALVVMRPEAGGGVFAEVLDMDEIAKIRASSKKSDSGPWADWFEEMAKKSPMKRLAKRLPIAREIQQVLDRDNYLYDIEHHQPETRFRRGSLTQQLDELAGGGTPALEDQTSTSRFAAMPDDVDQREPDRVRRDKAPEDNPTPRQKSSGAEPSPDPTEEEARADGAAAREAGKGRRAVPQRFRGDELLTRAWQDGFDGNVDEREPGEEEG